jgi:hypothetical protein
MPQTVTVDRPPVAEGAATVSASALAQHLDCSRAYVGKLEAEGVIQRQGDDGFPLDQSRVAYLRYLRCERQQSPRAAADAEHASTKAALLRLRIEEKQRELVRRADVDELLDAMCGTVLAHLSGMAVRDAAHVENGSRDLHGLERRGRHEVR